MRPKQKTVKNQKKQWSPSLDPFWLYDVCLRDDIYLLYTVWPAASQLTATVLLIWVNILSSLKLCFAKGSRIRTAAKTPNRNPTLPQTQKRRLNSMFGIGVTFSPSSKVYPFFLRVTREINPSSHLLNANQNLSLHIVRERVHQQKQPVVVGC